MSMDPEVKELVVEALRSGVYEKTTHQLRVDDSYCCLGVICDLYAKEHGEEWLPNRRYGSSNPTSYGLCGQEQFLPREVADWAGFSGRFGPRIKINGVVNDLAHHNDEDVTFVEIADAIEEQL